MHIFSYLIIFTSTEVLLETSVVWSAAKLFCFIYFCYSQKWLKNVKHLLLFPDLALISAFALQMTWLDFFSTKLSFFLCRDQESNQCLSVELH